MEPLLQWGLDCIRLIQSQANPPLTLLMKVFTHLGSTVVYIMVLPFVYWCVDEKKALRLGMAVLFSVWLNLFLKFLLDQPRPFLANYDPSLGMISETMGGLPSGHAQNSMVLWAIIASWVNKKWFWVISACFCLLVGFSRIYLGVHFPTDVLGGWIIGGVVLGVYFLAGKRIEALFSDYGPRLGLVVCATLSFIMILYRPSEVLLMPGAMILGLGTGYYLCKRKIGFSASALNGRTGIAKYLVLLIRFLLGITVLALWYVVTEKLMISFENSGNFNLFVFVRFGVIAFWISAGAPWIFRSTRLTDGAEDPPVRAE
jgi:membrane-associated phospholipid phosphatase